MFNSRYEDQSDDNNSICPYCKETFQDESEDYSEDTQEIECEGCGLKYLLYQSFSVTHHTIPDCELNGAEHQFERVKLNNGEEADFCCVCYKCRSIRAEYRRKY